MTGWRGGVVLLLAWMSLVAAGAWAAPDTKAAEPRTAEAKTAAPEAGAPLSLDAFFAGASFSGAQLSPNGRLLAVVKKHGDGWQVVVDDLDHNTAVAVIDNPDKNFFFNWLRWKGDGRLVLGCTYLKINRAGGRETGGVLGWTYGQVLAAVNRDGSGYTMLFKNDKATAWRTGNVMKLLDILDKDPDHILAVAADRYGSDIAWKVDIHTGAAQQLEQAGPLTLGWETDVNGDLTARYEVRGSSLVIQGRAPGAKDWTEVTRIKAKEFVKETADFELLGAAQAPGALYVAVAAKAGDPIQTRTVHVYDFRTHSLGPAVWPALPYDIAAIVRDDRTGGLDGVCYWADTYVCDYRDPEVQRNMRAVAKFFHDDRNLTPLSFSADGKWWLFSVSGPTERESYYVYDWAHRQVQFLGSRFPDLAEDRLGRMERFSYAASEGLKIPGYLTRPADAPKGPLPLIVMPHGGPETRDDFDFDLYTQVLATRGYLVFQPNFRGSAGYGTAFSEAGHRQWGLRMQSDITEGVKRLIETGQADPGRICIVGASYGGYAALIGGAQNPDLYKCVVSRAGISDLVSMMKWERREEGAGPASAFQYWRARIGDPDTDRDRLMAASAITYAASYGPPVLLIHGLDDEVVPPAQSRAMEKALKAAGRPVTLSLYKDEGHSEWSSKNERAGLEEIIAFVEKYIPPARPGK